LGYHPAIAQVWLEENLPKIGTSWRSWRRILKCYEHYSKCEDFNVASKFRYTATTLEQLPQWCQDAIRSFCHQKKKEFRNVSTIEKCQYPCIRFCRFLISNGIANFSDLTPDIIRAFSQSDQHSTFKGRSSYFAIIRQFLEYLERIGAVKCPYIHNSLSAGSAPVETVVDVLTTEQIKQVNKYRHTHNKPIELRNYAIVISGLKLGLRASDVVNLELSNIDWKKRQICIIQQKTQAQLTLPMPTDVGNALYLYIKNARPMSSTQHVFIRHKAPFVKLSTKNCVNALVAIIPERRTQKGGGFHVLRRTFATQLLRNNAEIDTIIDSLGHYNKATVMKYLSLDEERMKTCPLSLADTNLSLERGELL
jgi:integrase